MKDTALEPSWNRLAIVTVACISINQPHHLRTQEERARDVEVEQNFVVRDRLLRICGSFALSMRLLSSIDRCDLLFRLLGLDVSFYNTTELQNDFLQIVLSTRPSIMYDNE